MNRAYPRGHELARGFMDPQPAQASCWNLGSAPFPSDDCAVQRGQQHRRIAPVTDLCHHTLPERDQCVVAAADPRAGAWQRVWPKVVERLWDTRQPPGRVA